MKITKEKLINKIYENVKNELSPFLFEGKNNTILEKKLKKIIENTILEYLFHDNGSIFGSDKFEYDKEYDAIDYDTMQNVLDEGGWYYTDASIVKSPSGQQAIRFVLEFGANMSMNLQQLYSELKQRAMYPNGIKMSKLSNGRPILLVYRYQN